MGVMVLKKISAINLVVILILLLALGFTTTLAIKYWKEVSKLGNVTITIGTDEDIEMNVVKISPTFSGVLVPEGYAYFEGEVDQVLFEYSVSLDKVLIKTMNLLVEAIDIKIDGKTKYAHLVEVTIEEEVGKKEIDFLNETVTINIVVKLLEPVDANEALETGKLANVENGELAFQEIKGKQIEFVLRFNIEPKE